MPRGVVIGVCRPASALGSPRSAGRRARRHGCIHPAGSSSGGGDNPACLAHRMGDTDAQASARFQDPASLVYRTDHVGDVHQRTVGDDEVAAGTGDREAGTVWRECSRPRDRLLWRSATAGTGRRLRLGDRGDLHSRRRDSNGPSARPPVRRMARRHGGVPAAAAGGLYRVLVGGGPSLRHPQPLGSRFRTRTALGPKKARLGCSAWPVLGGSWAAGDPDRRLAVAVTQERHEYGLRNGPDPCHGDDRGDLRWRPGPRETP